MTFDALGSLVVSTVLCLVSVLLAGESRRLLIGESGSSAMTKSVRQLSSADPAVCYVGRPLTMQLGPSELLLTLELQFRTDLTIQQLCTAIDRIETRIQQAHPEVRWLFLEAVSLERAGSAKSAADGELAAREKH